MKTRSILATSAAAATLLVGLGVLGNCKQGKPAAAAPPGPVAADLSAERMMETATRLVEAGPAAEGQPSKDRVRELLVKELEATGARVKVLPFEAEVPGHGTWKLENVVASFRPEAKRRLLVGAHWDTRPWADEDPDPARRDRPITGANDGVSGTAVVLELARELGKRPPPEDVGVDLVLFDGEEGPKGTDAYFLGSKHLAESWFELGLPAPTKGVIVDMVGKKGLKVKREWNSDRMARGVNDRIFRIAKLRGATRFVDDEGPQVSDDHLAFQKRQIPVALLIDMNYPAWHTAADTLDQLDPAAMEEVGEVVLAWIREESAPGR